VLDAEDVEAVDALVAAWTQAVVAEDSFFADQSYSESNRDFQDELDAHFLE